MHSNNARTGRCPFWVACGALAIAGCAGSSTQASSGAATTGNAGMSGSTGTTSGAATGSGASAGVASGSSASAGSDASVNTSTGTVASAGSGAATGSGATGSTGAASGAGTGATAGQTSGAAQSGSGSVASGSDGGVSDAGLGGDGPVAVAGCTNNNYPLCLDFENGIDTTVWTGGTPTAITTVDFAHGGHSYRLYPMGGGTMTITKLRTITNQLWGRFYVHFKPEAPYGHGNILGAYDPANNWYEVGWQFNGILGDYHLAGGRERATRSKPVLVDQWYCIESFFDGTATNMPVWWIDGQVPAYYMADPPPPVPVVLQQFAKITVGFTPYAALGLNPPYGNPGPPALAEMYIDDIAFDTKRIGCIP
jgi:hypothetical protein